MRLLPNGNYEIENANTGERREVTAADLPKYGLSVPQPVEPILQNEPINSHPEQQARQSVLSSLGSLGVNLAKDIGGSIIAPVKRFGTGIGEGLALSNDQTGDNDLLNTSRTLSKKANEVEMAGDTEQANRLRKLAQENIDLIRKQADEKVKQTQKTVGDVEKGAVGTAGLFLPGGSTLAGRIAMGAVQGGVQGYSSSKQGEELPGIVGGAVVGGSLSTAGEGVRKGLGKISGNTKKLGDKLIATQYEDATRAQKTHNRLLDTVANLADYGLTSRDQVDKAAMELTGKTGGITQLTKQVVAQARPIEIGQVMRDGEMSPSLQTVAQDIISDPSVPATQDKKLTDYFKKIIQGVFYKNNQDPSLIGKADPVRVFDAIQDLEGRAADLVKSKNYGVGVSSESQALSTAYRDFASELKTRLYQDSGADQIQGVITPDNPVVQMIAKKYPKVAEKLMQAKTLAEVRSIAAPFVRGDKLVTAVEQGQTGAITAFNTGKGLGRVVPNILGAGEPVKQALSTDAANRVAGTALRNIGNLTTKELPPIVGNIAMSNVVNSLNQLGEQNVNQEVNQGINDAQNNNSKGQTNNSFNSDNNHLPIISQTLTGHTPEEHYAAYMQARNAGDKRAASQILQDYNAETAYQKSQQSNKINTNAQKSYTQAANAENIVDKINELWTAIPGKRQSGIMGRAKGYIEQKAAGAGYNDALTTYNTFVNANIEAIARGISGQTGVLRKEERQAAIDLMPKVTDTPGEVSAKMNAIKSLIVQQKSTNQSLLRSANIQDQLPEIQ